MQSSLPEAARLAMDFEEVILPNGLCVRLLPMPDYGAVHAIYATRFGSIDRAFSQSGTQHSIPSGVAHFLEHKMFENEDGVDAFSLYAATGAAANAYTSFDRTSYIFTATTDLERNLDILLSFVGHPHFTRETVEKELGIIAQEIGMYRDNAEMRCFFGILESLYHHHPIRDDIAGTVESIGTISPEMLYACTDAFYAPANMGLFVAGNLSMSQLLAAVNRAALPAQKAPPVQRSFPAEPTAVARPEHRFSMPVSMPLFALGFKETPLEGPSVETEVLADLLGELLFGESSTLYRRLYDEGLVQPDFGCEFGLHDGCFHFVVSGESEKPETVREMVLAEIERQRTEGISAEQFDICKKMMYGESIADLESVERVASLLSSSYFRGRTPAMELAAIAGATREDTQNALNRWFSIDRSAFLVIDPLQ